MSVSELLLCLIHRTGVFGPYKKALAHLNYQEHGKAYEIWLGLAKEGSAQAQYDLGVMLHNGLGMDKDPIRSIYWFEKAAAQHHADAENYLGAIYKTGNGAPQDIEKALHFLKRAMEHGNDAAQRNYPELLSEGLPEKFDKAL